VEVPHGMSLLTWAITRLVTPTICDCQRREAIRLVAAAGATRAHLEPG
jgi:hypothetical protein